MTTLGLRARKHQRTRDALVSTALRLFKRRGFDGVSVEEIAAAAEVAPRTFYRYFPTKEDVLFSGTAAESVLEHTLSSGKVGESDATYVARAMCDAMLADRERVDQTRAIVAASPALRGRALLMTMHTTRIVAAHLAQTAPTKRDVHFRAEIVAAAITTTIRTAFFAWLDGGCRGSAWRRCQTALDTLRESLV